MNSAAGKRKQLKELPNNRAFKTTFPPRPWPGVSEQSLAGERTEWPAARAEVAGARADGEGKAGEMLWAASSSEAAHNTALSIGMVSRGQTLPRRTE